MGKKEEEEAEEEEEENEGLFLRQKWDRTVDFSSPFARLKTGLGEYRPALPLLEARSPSSSRERE